MRHTKGGNFCSHNFVRSDFVYSAGFFGDKYNRLTSNTEPARSDGKIKGLYTESELTRRVHASAGRISPEAWISTWIGIRL